MHAIKTELRHDMRQRRLALAPASAWHAAEHAAAAALPELENARIVALYAPVRGEIGTAPLAALLRSMNKIICYPRMGADRMLAFHTVHDEAVLAQNGLGIHEPPIHTEAVLPDAIVVPGLAFDASGGRLGWGHAYYDTTLAHAHSALRVGYAYEFQIVTCVPQSDADERMDILVTERGARHTHARSNATLGRSP